MIKFCEHSSANYVDRTADNIYLSDLTIAIADDFKSLGEIATRNLCSKLNKLYIPIDLKEEITNILIDEIISILNMQIQVIDISHINLPNLNTLEKIKFNLPHIIKKNDIIEFKNNNKSYIFRADSESISIDDILLLNSYYENRIEKLKSFQVFVFGSNTQGIHGAGGALFARQNCGAIIGKPKGLVGQSYGIVTKDLTCKENNALRSISKENIIEQIIDLYLFANKNQQLEFLISYNQFGKNLNGYSNQEMINMFAEASNQISIPNNITFEKNFLKNLKEQIFYNAYEYYEDGGSVDLYQVHLTRSNEIKLNIAGNGIYTLKNKFSQEFCDEFVLKLLTKICERSHKLKISHVRSGGQTGIDESGIKAAKKLNINSEVLAPKNWKFRDISGKDIYNEIEFKKRFIN